MNTQLKHQEEYAKKGWRIVNLESPPQPRPEPVSVARVVIEVIMALAVFVICGIAAWVLL